MTLLFFFQAEDGIRDVAVTGVQTCALPIWRAALHPPPSHAGRADGPALHGALRRLARRRLSPHPARRRDLPLPARGEPSFGKAPPPVRGGAHGLPRRAGGWAREQRTPAEHDDRTRLPRPAGRAPR